MTKSRTACNHFLMDDLIDKMVFPSGKPTTINKVAEQYRLAVEMWDRARARRQLTNTFYLTINAAFVAGIKIADIDAITLPLRYLSLVGLVMCALWIASILMYKSLTDDKQRIIVKLEEVMPCSPFSAEALQDKHGKKGFRLRHFALVELGVPIAFAVAYLVILLNLLNVAHHSPD